MKKSWIKSIVLVLLVATLALGYQTGYTQSTSSVFVVYGTMTRDNGTPIDGGYSVVVTNLVTGMSNEGSIDTGQNAGKYSVVFINFEGGSAATVGDILQISVRIEQGQTATSYMAYEVTAQDILDMRVMIDIIEPQVATDSRTWGAIKSLFD